MSESSDQLQEPANPELIRLMPREKIVEAARMIVSAGQGMLEATGHPGNDAARHFGAIMAAFPYAVSLAGAVLAREDDSPITEEWLEAKGGVKIHLGWRFGNAFVVADSSPRYLSLIDHDGMLAIVVGPATRRHVLLAMELFGIEPK